VLRLSAQARGQNPAGLIGNDVAISINTSEFWGLDPPERDGELVPFSQ
jgi:hypothetical protein